MDKKQPGGSLDKGSVNTVDGRNPALQLMDSLSIIYRVLYMPGGCLGFLSSTVCLKTPFSMETHPGSLGCFQLDEVLSIRYVALSVLLI